jgi:NlpC/P60 family putative phage cell wall peptidase
MTLPPSASPPFGISPARGENEESSSSIAGEVVWSAAGGSVHQPTLITSIARTWIGTPYQHQASLKHVGCDCLGLVRGVWRELHGTEPEIPPPYSPDWAEAGGNEALADAGHRHLINIPCTEFGAGDVLLFRWRRHLPAKHAGIATSKSTMIHAQDGVAVSQVSLSAWWLNRLAFAFRFP